MFQRLRAAVIRILFYPTLGWNLLLEKLGLRRWWDWVDDRVLIGALPSADRVPELRRMGIGAVVNLCAEFPGARAALAEAGMEQLHLPVLDFTPPAIEQIRSGVEFIRERARRGDKVYVHCKAGRGRSATVVICWLMAEEGLDPEAAQARLAARRPAINRHLARREVVRRYHRELRAAAARES